MFLMKFTGREHFFGSPKCGGFPHIEEAAPARKEGALI
jgi:hypothetical protein